MVRIVVEQHPALENGPVEIEAAKDEVEPIRKGVLSSSVLSSTRATGQSRKLSRWRSRSSTTSLAVWTWRTLYGAQPAYPPRKQARPTPASAGDKLDYSTLEHAGKPHRGNTTDTEKETVRHNLAASMTV